MIHNKVSLPITTRWSYSTASLFHSGNCSNSSSRLQLSQRSWSTATWTVCLFPQSLPRAWVGPSLRSACKGWGWWSYVGQEAVLPCASGTCPVFWTVERQVKGWVGWPWLFSLFFVGFSWAVALPSFLVPTCHEPYVWFFLHPWIQYAAAGTSWAGCWHTFPSVKWSTAVQYLPLLGARPPPAPAAAGAVTVIKLGDGVDYALAVALISELI